MSTERGPISPNLLHNAEKGHTVQYDGTGLFNSDGSPISLDSPGVTGLPQQKGAEVAKKQALSDIAAAGYQAAKNIKGTT